MPQMAPSNWLIMMFIFNFIFMHYTAFNHFNKLSFKSLFVQKFCLLPFKYKISW